MRSAIGGAHVTDAGLGLAGARMVLHRVWRLLGPIRAQAALGVGLAVVQALAVLACPVLLQVGIDEGVLAGDRGRLTAVAVAFVACVAVSWSAGGAAVWVVGRAGERFLLVLRERVFAHLLRLDAGYFDRHPAGQVVARLTSDVEAVGDLVQQGLVTFVVSGVVFTGALVAMVVLSWQLALCVLVAAPVLVVVSRAFQRRSNLTYLRVRQSIGAATAALQEDLAGVRVLQAHAREGDRSERFARANEAQFRANERALRLEALYFPFVELVGIASVAVTLAAGGWLTARGALTVGAVGAFVVYLGNLFEPVQQMSQLFGAFQSAGAALRTLFDVLDTPTATRESPGAVDLPVRGELVLAGASLRYGTGAWALRDVDLVLAPGERLAVVGPTGAGKSSLAKLLVRAYDPTEGAVRFGGVDLRVATVASRRERIVLIAQEGRVFRGTVADNIRLARRGATDGEVAAVVADLGLAEAFAALPDGLATELREGGSRLSAGQRQLVALARAGLADPAVLVLDEATSNLDPGLERAAERALQRVMEGRTVIVVAHRLATAARADRIAVIDGGRLVELGAHDELVARGGVYAGLERAWRAGQTDSDVPHLGN